MKKLKCVAVFCISLLFFNCGKAEKKQVNSEPVIEEVLEMASDNADTNVAQIMLHADDKMTFDLKRIKVKKGQKVIITLMHTGKMPKNVMGHNFVLLNKGVNMSTFASKAASAADHEYVPEDSEDVIAYTKLLGGGETDVIEFNAPEVGIYDFLCTFPGHYALMKGKFIVE